MNNVRLTQALIKATDKRAKALIEAYLKKGKDGK